MKVKADKATANATTAADAPGNKGRQRRADAVRNREHLLRSAAKTFLDEGPRVTMEKIAQNAGVGVGTLYRHFPDRTALIEALSERAYEVVVAVAHQARESLTDEPLGAIRTFLFGVIERRDMIVLPLTGGPIYPSQANDQARQEIFRQLEHILESGRQQGHIRHDVNALDIMLAGAYFVRRLPNLPDAPAAVRRQAQIFVDGLRPVSPSLGERALTLTELENAWRRRLGKEDV